MRRRTAKLVLGGVFAWLTSLLAPGVAFSLAPASGSQAQAPADPVATALDHFYNLEYQEAENQLDAWVAGHPDDLRALSYLANTILEGELFRRQMLDAQAFATGGVAFKGPRASVPPSLRRRLFDVLGRIDRQTGQRLAQNPRDQDALYWAGAAHVTRAIYFLTLEKARLSALSEAKEAHQLHERLLEVNPQYVDAYLVVGTYHYLVGSLPLLTRVFAAFAGYHGDRAKGIAEVARVAREGHWARDDAKTILAILDYREKRYGEALQVLRSLEETYPRNFIVPQQIARIQKAEGDWRSAANTYDDILTKHESAAPGYRNIPAATIYFQAGEAHAHLSENEAALERYSKAAALREKNIYVYRAELAAADLDLRLARRDEARQRYQRVARAIPSTDEGRAAQRALQGFASTSPKGDPSK